MSEAEQQVDQTAEEQAPAQPDLTITDLQNLRAIIDVASTRGAFKAAEMAAVGTVFNKLDAFLNAVAPAQQAQTPPAQ
jgi:hypothetical protein